MTNDGKDARTNLKTEAEIRATVKGKHSNNDLIL